MLARARSGRPDGQCNRKQTADGPGNRSQVRVKRCGKSAPAYGAIRPAWSTPPGARSSRGFGLLARDALASQPSGRSLRWMVTGYFGTHRIPLTARLTVTLCSQLRRSQAHHVRSCAALRDSRADRSTGSGFVDPLRRDRNVATTTTPDQLRSARAARSTTPAQRSEAVSHRTRR